MAPFYGDTVLLCVICFVFLCLVDNSLCLLQYDRHELLLIRDNQPDLNFSVPDHWKDVAANANSVYANQHSHKRPPRKRGKRSGVLVRLRQRKHRSPLPSIILSNVRSLVNKQDELATLIRAKRDAADSAVLCFTETWLDDSIPDSGVSLPGFSLLRADRTEDSLKKKGGGVCFFINQRWCTDSTILSRSCSPELETLIVRCRPFYLPRDFASVILAAVYIPPSAGAKDACIQLAAQITKVENSNPDSVVLILGDFNHVNVKKSLPKYKQQISVATRGDKTLDHCYCVISNAYHSVAWPPLGQSDHNTIFLIPRYRQKLKSVKPTKRTVKQWSNEAQDSLKDCFTTTDWSVFKDSCPDLDEYSDTVTSYINFVENICIPSKTVSVYSNNKPWFSKEIKLLYLERKKAFQSRDMDLYKIAKYKFESAVKKAKARYRAKLESKLNAHDSKGVWHSLKQITNYKTNHTVLDDDPSLPNKLNKYFCRFDAQPLINSSFSSSIAPLVPPFLVEEHEVRNLLKSQNCRKAAGPDLVSAATIKWCADELSMVFTDIFNLSLNACKVPACFKSAIIVPVPKKTNVGCLNDYRPVALTSVIMKVFEKLVTRYLSSVTLDSFQFAYRKKRSVEDAVSLCIHSILQHLEANATYARILFIDFSSAFNNIIPARLCDKLLQMGVNGSMCNWVFDFLTNRSQVVKVNNKLSESMSISIGAPQGCVLSPLLYLLYTNDCISHSDSVQFFKFADDTTVTGLISGNDETAYRAEVSSLVEWCTQNNLSLNISKTKEMVVDFRKNKVELQPLLINDQIVETVESFKFLGTTISSSLKWNSNVNLIVKKAHQRLFFLRQLKKFKVSKAGMCDFYRAVIESVLTFSITVWFGNCSAEDREELNRVVKTASKIIGKELPSIGDIYNTRILKLGLRIFRDPSHPANALSVPLPSGKRVRSIKSRTTRLRNSSYPEAVRALNSSAVQFMNPV